MGARHFRIAEARMFLLRRCAIIGIALALTAQAAPAGQVVVFAAASLKTALDEVIAGWTGGEATASYAASPALARQIELGAPADIFISADAAWMDHLAARGLIREHTRINLLSNRLVLIAHGRGAAPVTLGPETDIAALLGDGRLAIAEVSAVPAGRYGRAALESLGLWDRVEDRLAQAENPRAALSLVSRGEAPLGIVYATDAAADDGVSVVATFPSESHPPITYPMAALSGGDATAAAAFALHLTSVAARAAFVRQGFRVLH